MKRPDDSARESAEPDPGDPLTELRILEEEPSGRFVDRVCDGINRRQAGAHLLEMSWWGLTGLVMELLQVFFRAFLPGRDEEREG